MLSTIWMWTHEWSDMPSRRVALTAETCHHAFTCSSALTALEQPLELAVAARRDADADVGDRLARRAVGRVDLRAGPRWRHGAGRIGAHDVKPLRRPSSQRRG